MDLVADLGLEQIVHEITHEGSIFDLVLTNRPDLVPRVETVPRMSDHEIVYFECITCSPKKITPDPYHCTTKPTGLPSGKTCLFFMKRCPLWSRNRTPQLKRCGSY